MVLRQGDFWLGSGAEDSLAGFNGETGNDSSSAASQFTLFAFGLGEELFTIATLATFQLRDGLGNHGIDLISCVPEIFASNQEVSHGHPKERACIAEMASLDLPVNEALRFLSRSTLMACLPRNFSPVLILRMRQDVLSRKQAPNPNVVHLR